MRSSASNWLRMRWPLLLVAAFAASILPAASRSELDTVEAKLRSGGQVKLAAIGDSITYLCFHTDFRRNYLTFVADALRKSYPTAKLSVEISGNRGTTRLGLGYLDALLDTRPDVVFVMFGMNDCAGGPGKIEDYDRNLSEFVRRIRRRGAVPILLTQNQIVYASSDGRKRAALPGYMHRAVEVAFREKVLVVDNFAEWSHLRAVDPDWTLYLNDAIHPNLAGHRRFARVILQQIWPDAAAAHESGLRFPLPLAMQTAVDTVLPGPTAAQILRVGESTWLALTGRRRDGHTSDLVLSVCESKGGTNWSGCTHHNLVGPGAGALFPWAECEINSAMLLAGPDRIYVAFSQTVRFSMLTIDTSQPGWLGRLGSRPAYSAIISSELPLPQALRGSYQASCEILDGMTDSAGYPAFLVRDYVNGEGSGVAWLSFSPALGEYTQSLQWPPGLNPARGRVPVDFLVNAGIKPDDRPWRYEGRPPQKASHLAVLWEDEGLHLREVPIPK